MWIVGFGLATILICLGGLVNQSGQAAALVTKLLFLAVWLGISPLLIAWGEPLMRVRLDEDYLYLSDWRREVRIPFHQISSVAQDGRANAQIFIRLKAPCVFGEKITFQPRRELVFWLEHPIVGELRRRAGLPTAG
jgi:hypothetical protein